MHIRPIHNHIIFQFEDAVSGGAFQEKTNWGFSIISKASSDSDAQAKTPRWGKVISIGPDVKDVKVGDEILVEALMWTAGIEVDGQKFWRTDNTKVLAIRE